MEDFNVPSAERVALLERLQETVGDAPPYFWASCQVCEVKALEILVDVARISPSIVRVLAVQCYYMLRYWGSNPGKLPGTSNLSSSSATSSPAAKRQKTSDSPTGSVTSSRVLSRNKVAWAEAQARDKFCCVLTGSPVIDVAHIYPFHSIKHEEKDIYGARHAFWDQLRNFWPEEKVTAWQAELFPDGVGTFGVEKADNLVTLSSDAHRLWGRGAFALKPISVSDDNTTLKVQFFWQKRHTYSQATAMSLLTTPFSTQVLDRNEGAYDHGTAVLFDPRRNQFIKSGDYIELQSDDPMQRPLPSFQLLEMQWFLQRVAGMAGAIDEYIKPWSDFSDDDSLQRVADVAGAADDYFKSWSEEVSDEDTLQHVAGTAGTTDEHGISLSEVSDEDVPKLEID